MWELPCYFWFSWFGFVALSLHSQDVLARESRYTPVFGRMEVEYSALKSVANPAEIRQKHSAAIRAFGNFSLDPCNNLVDFSCMGHNNDMLDGGSALTSGEYDLEILRYQIKDLLVSNFTAFDNEAERKLKLFFDSCLSYVPSRKDFESVARKLLALIDNATVWSDAYIGLQSYGIDFFLTYSFNSSVHVQSWSDEILQKSHQELREVVRNVLLISNGMGRDESEVAQKIFRFFKSFQRIETNSSSGEVRPLNRLQELYPALYLRKILRARFGFYKQQESIAVEHTFLEALNSLLQSTPADTIKDVMKVIAYNKLRATEREFSTSNAIERCLDMTQVFFEPALQSLYIRNRISDQTRRSVNEILQDILEAFVKEIRASPDLTKAEKRRAASKVNSKKDLIDRNFMIYDPYYLDSLYEFLDVEKKAGFLELYFDTVLNHNKKMSRCLGLQRSFGRTPEELRQPDRLKPHLICWGDIPEEFPMIFLNIPYYNPAYPKFWTYGALSYALFWYSLQVDDSNVPFNRVRFSVWDVFAAAYRKYADDIGELTGYEELNLTAMQAFVVAHIQAACNQIGERNFEYYYLAREPVIAEIFSCN